jgi:GDP-L-fucose synthase
MGKQPPVFVAGHTGLIGSAFVRRLRRAGRSDIICAPHSQLDLRDPAAVRDFLHRTRPGLLVLAAGRVGGIVENRDHPADMLTTNLAIAVSVLPAALEAGVSQVLFFGSSCMYPRECAQPMPESALLTGRPEPSSLAYAISKLAGLELCRALNQQRGSTRFYPVVPNSAYGPGDNFDPESSHVLSALIHRFHEARESGSDRAVVWGSGQPRREFVHADDVADACLFLLEHETDPAAYPFNIGVGSDVSIAELAETVARVVGFEGEITFDTSMPEGAPRKLLDSARLGQLGWKPSIGLERGIEQSYEWYVKQRATAGGGRS